MTKQPTACYDLIAASRYLERESALETRPRSGHFLNVAFRGARKWCHHGPQEATPRSLPLYCEIHARPDRLRGSDSECDLRLVQMINSREGRSNGSSLFIFFSASRVGSRSRSAPHNTASRDTARIASAACIRCLSCSWQQHGATAGSVGSAVHRPDAAAGCRRSNRDASRDVRMG